MHPLFSIITVARNASATIEPTLKSVAVQSCKLFEYILIDGASTDDTVQKAEKLSIPGMKIVSEPDKGTYDAMNKGLMMASGDYVIFLNAGDSFHSPETLQILANAALDNDYPGIIYGDTAIVDADRKFLRMRHLTPPDHLTHESFRNGMLVCHQAFVALRKITSPYKIKYKYSADFEWCIRCLQNSRRNLYVRETLVDYLNEGLTTANHRKSLMERFHIMGHYYGYLPTMLRHVKFLFRSVVNHS